MKFSSIGQCPAGEYLSGFFNTGSKICVPLPAAAAAPPPAAPAGFSVVPSVGNGWCDAPSGKGKFNTNGLISGTPGSGIMAGLLPAPMAMTAVVIGPTGTVMVPGTFGCEDFGFNDATGCSLTWQYQEAATGATTTATFNLPPMTCP